MQDLVSSAYLPVSPLMVFMAMTVVGAMPPKLKLQSLICHELEFTCFSNNTLIAVFTMAISSSRRRACLKAKTCSCYKKTHKKNVISILFFPQIVSLFFRNTCSFSVFNLIFIPALLFFCYSLDFFLRGFFEGWLEFGLGSGDTPCRGLNVLLCYPLPWANCLNKQINK